VKDKGSKKNSKKGKQCPPGKKLSPKGRCVIDRGSNQKGKQCPPGKKLSPKGRCVIDRGSNKSKSNKSKSRKSSNKLDCIRSDEKKYLARKSPPIPANSCPEGKKALGNDGNTWVTVSYRSKTGYSNRWVLDKGKVVTKRTKKALKNSTNNTKPCLVSSDKKYDKRSSPPIPANSCPTGYVREGNDGEDYQAVSYPTKTGNANRWVKCGKANTTC
jgi:hypothetical protein